MKYIIINYELSGLAMGSAETSGPIQVSWYKNGMDYHDIAGGEICSKIANAIPQMEAGKSVAIYGNRYRIKR